MYPNRKTFKQKSNICKSILKNKKSEEKILRFFYFKKKISFEQTIQVAITPKIAKGKITFSYKDSVYTYLYRHKGTNFLPQSLFSKFTFLISISLYFDLRIYNPLKTIKIKVRKSANLLSKIFHDLIIRLSQRDNTIITKR